MAQSRNDDVFKNPMNLPLDQLYLKVNTKRGEKEICALNEFWIYPDVYPHFTKIPFGNPEKLLRWQKTANNYIKALIHLKNLDYHMFWNELVYNKEVNLSLMSFLKNGIPPYNKHPTGSIGECYCKIYNLVFLIYNRILTVKESQKEHMSKKTLKELFFSHNIINCGTVWKLVRIYGNSNNNLLPNMLRTIFEIMPDLSNEIEYTLTQIGNMFDAVGNNIYDNYINEAVLIKYVNILFDAIFSVKMLLKVYDPIICICLRSDVYQRIVSLYNDELPLLLYSLKSVLIDDNHPIYDKMENLNVECLEVCHILMSNCVDKILQMQDNDTAKSEWNTIFLNLIHATVDDEQFRYDYNTLYPLESIIKLVSSVCPGDVEDLSSALKMCKLNEETSVSNGLHESDDENEELDVSKDTELDKKIMQVLDVLPDLGYGFVERCLDAMNNDPEAVVMAIMEENLPSELRNIDRSLPKIPEEDDKDLNGDIASAQIGKKGQKYENANEMLDDKTHVSELRSRYLELGLLPDDPLHIYNDDYDDGRDYPISTVAVYDDFDIEATPVPKHLRHLYEEEPQKKNKFDNDDEVDEDEEDEEDATQNTTVKKDAAKSSRGYDKNKQKYGARNSDLEFKPKKWRQKDLEDMNNASGTSAINNAPGTSGRKDYYSQRTRDRNHIEDGSMASGSTTKERDLFCENPADVRARREARYEQKYGARRRNVVGNPKGEGQDKEVLINRDKKNVHKSSIANHNRKAGAQWKRNRF